MIKEETINWLLSGDAAIQYQTKRDLLRYKDRRLQTCISTDGWGADFLSKQRPDGHWSRGFYQVKWISTHYTLLDLRTLCLQPGLTRINRIINKLSLEEKSDDGGINPARTIAASDICVNGMFLNYASYFKAKESSLNSIVDFILSQQLPDCGFNCRLNRSGASHSSLHSTLSVVEGLFEYEINGYKYRIEEARAARLQAEEFILVHRLFLSDHTGSVIDKRFLNLSFPCRWRYDILRALDHFQYSGRLFDSRMQNAIDVIRAKQKSDGRWLLPARHPGLVHFEMEKAGKPSRWNTLRCLRVLNHFGAN